MLERDAVPAAGSVPREAPLLAVCECRENRHGEDAIAVAADSLDACPYVNDIKATLRPIPVLITDSGSDAVSDTFVVNYGSSERTVSALAALASDGAAILIAGVDDEAARIAAGFAESARIPVLLLRPPREEAERKFGFVAGEDDENVARALVAELAERGRSRPVRVGAGGVACDSTAAFAGRSRFPVEQWKKQSNDAVIVLGDASCARDVASEVARVRLPAHGSVWRAVHRPPLGGTPSRATVAGVDPGAVVLHEASILVPVAFLVAWEAGKEVFRSAWGGLAVLLAQVAMFGLAAGSGGSYRALALPATTSRQPRRAGSQ